MEEGYELDLTYITERIIAVSFPRGCSEEVYAHNLRDVTRMLKSKHADNYLIINLSEKRPDLTRMNPKTLDSGWPDQHAPPLDKICTICKAMEGWLNADLLHVVVIHCRGGKGRVGVVISSFVHFTDVSASADQALDRFAMRKYYDDKVSALMTPSQKRYVWILNSLLSGSMKINASPLFLHCVILHGVPSFDSTGACRPYIKVYQGMQAVYSSAVYLIGPGHRDRVCITLEPAQLLKGDIMIKCYHRSEVPPQREVVFRLQFHTGAVQGYNLMFEKEDMESANTDRRFPDYGKVELVFSEGPEKIPGADRWQNGAHVVVDYNTADPLTRWDSYQNLCDGEAPRSHGLIQDRGASKRSPSGAGGGGGAGGGSAGGRGGAGGGREATLSQGVQTTSATSSPDHSDHALSVSSDSGLSSTSLWADRPTRTTGTSGTTGTTGTSGTTGTTGTSGTIGPLRVHQGPSQQEKVQLKRLLSGFGLEDMDPQGPRAGAPPAVLAPPHVNGDAGPQERETDILDDEVMASHDLHSVDSLGTLSSSCHKSSQNSLLSDGFGSPGGGGGEEQQSPNQDHLLPPHAPPPPAEEYERSYAKPRRGFASRSHSVASAHPGTAPPPKQHVYRQGSYSTQSWVRQQQLVAAQQFVYTPEDGNVSRYAGHQSGSGSTRTGTTAEPPRPSKDAAAARDGVRKVAPLMERATINNNNNNKRDEEFQSLTKDIDNSIDQLNQLIMDLDPASMGGANHGGPAHRNGGTHLNGTSNGVSRRYHDDDDNTVTLKSSQQTAVHSMEGQTGATRTLIHQSRDVLDHPGFWSETEDFRNQRAYTQRPLLYREDSADYAAPQPDVDGVVEAPPTPAFPISPPTPYVKNMSEFTHLRPPHGGGGVQSYGCFRSDLEPRGYLEVGHGAVESLPECHRNRTLTHSVSVGGTLQQSDRPAWPVEHPVLTRHASLSGYPPPTRPPAPQDYSHHAHIHPAPNAHSSPRSSQRSRMARYALNRSPARSFEEPDDPGPDSPAAATERELLAALDGQRQPHPAQLLLLPPLPEKKRASDGEHSLGTASPALSGFSSPHSGSSLSIPFPNVLPDLSAQRSGSASPLPDLLVSKQVTVKFVQDTSKFWYKPDISRDQAISVLKDKEPGCFIVRDSHSFKGAYGLAMKVATPPPSVLQQSKKGGDLSNELVRHFLIECTQRGVRLKGCPNEPYFGSLTALVCQHSITPLALPCKLIIPDHDPLDDVVENSSQSVTNSAAELLKQGAACNVWFLGSVEMESLTGVQAVQKATSMTLSSAPPPTSTVVHFKVSSQGITLTDNQRKLFFRRHYNVNTVIFCALDPQDRNWKKDGCSSAKIFGFVARKTGTSTDNICHLFAEHDPEQPASAIVNFVSKVMIGSHKSK